MKKYVLYGVLALLVPVGLLAGVATGTNPHNPPDETTTNGHTPVTICHKPGTPAEQTLVVDDDSVELTGHLGHGDTLGPCEDTTEEPPGDTEEPPVVTPPAPGPTCAFVGADKDGGVDAYGGTNDDCAPFPSKAEEPQAPAICPIPEVKVVTVAGPTKVIVKKGKTKVVVKTKIKVVYRTKVVVKIKKVYVPGIYANGVAGKG